MPSISYAYGLFDKDKTLIGILTIGKPASPPLCKGVLGIEYSNLIYELNRLVINENLPKNILSWFVSKVLKNLNQIEIVLISYADTAMNHHGYIYQATNWIYTGLTKSRTDKYTENGKHCRHYNNDNLNLRKVRSSKHRYIWFSKKCKKLMQYLKYPIVEYPKGDNKKYELGYKIQDIIIDTYKN